MPRHKCSLNAKAIRGEGPNTDTRPLDLTVPTSIFHTFTLPPFLSYPTGIMKGFLREAIYTVSNQNARSVLAIPRFISFLFVLSVFSLPSLSHSLSHSPKMQHDTLVDRFLFLSHVGGDGKTNKEDKIMTIKYNFSLDQFAMTIPPPLTVPELRLTRLWSR